MSLKPRLLWLLFVLMVALVVAAPKLLHAQEREAFLTCRNGLCVLPERVLEKLVSLAEKAGKDCI